jgi:DNA-binding CsgD family transcriptional regulator
MLMQTGIVSHGADGAFAVDARQRIVSWDPACEQLLGIRPGDALGSLCCEVIHGCDPRGDPFCRPGCRVAQLANGGAPPQAFALWVRDGQGNRQRVSVRIGMLPAQWTDQWTVVHQLRRGEPDVPEGNPPALTGREWEIFRLRAQGLPVAAISQRLHISPATVRNHIQHLMAKLGLHSQVEAAVYAHRHNLV